jgi:hypothetical protein
MSADMLSGFGGLLLSLCFNYIPGLRTKYAGLTSEQKSGVMALALILVVGLLAASSCAKLWVMVSCDKVGFMQLASMLGTALVVNQASYKLTPQPDDVKAAKAARLVPAPVVLAGGPVNPEIPDAKL